MSHDNHKKQTCRYSDLPLEKPFLELGVMPLANSYVKLEDKGKEEFQCPLSLVYAQESGLVQLSHVVPPDLMFKNYLYVSSTTKTFQKHFSEYAQSVKKKIGDPQGAVAVDIGSNDGALVALYQEEGFQGVGVDPAENLAKEANAIGRRTINRYFDREAVNQIVEEFGKARVVSGNNVFAHIDDVHSVCDNVYNLITDDGFFVIEFPYLGVMLDKLYFDMIYHEHLSYIAIKPLQFLLEKHNMEVFDIQEVDSHGGSLRVFIQKKGVGAFDIEPIVDRFVSEETEKGYDKPEVYEEFARKVYKVKEDLIACVKDIRAQGKTIAGYGAPAKASTIINFCQFTNEDIDYVVDDNPMKQNHLVPGAQIPIVSSVMLEEEPKDYVFIFAWNFAKEILGKIGHLKEKGVKFIVPLLKQEGEVDAEAPSYQVIS